VWKSREGYPLLIGILHKRNELGSAYGSFNHGGRRKRNRPVIEKKGGIKKLTNGVSSLNRPDQKTTARTQSRSQMGAEGPFEMLWKGVQ